MAYAGVYTYTYKLSLSLSLSPRVHVHMHTHFLGLQGSDLMWKAFVHASHTEQTVHLAPGYSAAENCLHMWGEPLSSSVSSVLVHPEREKEEALQKPRL